MVSVLLIVVWGFSTAPMAKFNIGAGDPSFPEGTVVLITISGEGCNCVTPTQAGSTNSSGIAKVSFEAFWGTHRGEVIDTENCKAFAVALVGGKLWRGNASLTLSSGGTYTATIKMAP